MPSAYLDVPAYLRAALNLETASLLGLNTAVGGNAALPAGATTLPVAASDGWAVGPLWLLDSPSSEVVQVTAAPDATHLTLAAPGTRFAHAPGVSASQGGPGGALADVILRASAWIEGYCQHGADPTDRSLFALSRVERWGMPSARAGLDRDGVLFIRPGHFPVQSVAAVAVELAPGESLALDATRAEVASSGRVVEVPYLLGTQATSGLPFLLGCAGLSRSRRQWVTLTYTGGLAPGGLPYDLQLACVWVTSELLAERRNPTGAASLHLGKFALEARLRGDPVGDSLLLVQAKRALDPYRAMPL